MYLQLQTIPIHQVYFSRKLIRFEVDVNGKKEKIKFFYPFEVQIMDYHTYVNNMRGPLSHSEYKKRQHKAARLRLFGQTPEENM